jgi:uncharacterized RDD family membrane protein YckC
MPIPYYVPENSLVDVSPRIQLLAPVSFPLAEKKIPLFAAARFAAHLIDLALVMGLSFYASKLISLGFLSIYRSELEGLGRGAGSVFAEAYEYANGQLLGGCVAFFGILYFVGLPVLKGRTLGLGLMGLKIVDQNGNVPSELALARRFLASLLVYASGGILLLPGLRGRKSRLPQDTYSESFISKA